eukprot:3255299-Prymnesium_polylepis.1
MLCVSRSQFNHVESGMSGAVAAPVIQEHSLAANVARSLATARSELPGEGPAVVEASSLAPASGQELAPA